MFASYDLAPRPAIRIAIHSGQSHLKNQYFIIISNEFHLVIPECFCRGSIKNMGQLRLLPDNALPQNKKCNQKEEKGVASCFAHLDQTVIQKAMRLFRPAFQCIYGSGKYHAGMSGRMSPRSFLDYNGQASSDIGAFLIR